MVWEKITTVEYSIYFGTDILQLPMFKSYDKAWQTTTTTYKVVYNAPARLEYMISVCLSDRDCARLSAGPLYHKLRRDHARVAELWRHR